MFSRQPLASADCGREKSGSFGAVSANNTTGPLSTSCNSLRRMAAGDDTVVLPFISDEEAERMFADLGGFRKVRSYLRYVRDPSLRRL